MRLFQVALPVVMVVQFVTVDGSQVIKEDSWQTDADIVRCNELASQREATDNAKLAKSLEGYRVRIKCKPQT